MTDRPAGMYRPWGRMLSGASMEVAWRRYAVKDSDLLQTALAIGAFRADFSMRTGYLAIVRRLEAKFRRLACKRAHLWVELSGLEQVALWFIFTAGYPGRRAKVGLFADAILAWGLLGRGEDVREFLDGWKLRERTAG